MPGCALHPRSRAPMCAKKMRTRAYRFSGGIRHSLRKGDYADVITLNSLSYLFECSHLYRDSRCCLDGNKYLVLWSAAESLVHFLSPSATSALSSDPSAS